MKTKVKSEMGDDLPPEYDVSKLLKSGIRGKYAKRSRTGSQSALF